MEKCTLGNSGVDTLMEVESGNGEMETSMRGNMRMGSNKER